MNIVLVDAPTNKMHTNAAPYYGVLGLSPEDDTISGPSYMTTLYDQDKITQKVFSFLPLAIGVEGDWTTRKG
jgi:hypothetical protein